MKNYFLLAVALMMLVSYGCLKKAIPVPDPTNTQPAQKFVFTPSKNPVITPVTGKWQWVFTYAGEGGLCTPASIHGTRVIEFDADSTVKQFSNDTLVQHENYTYLSSYKFEDSTTMPALAFGHAYFQTFIKNDTLNINLPGIDPVFSKYVPAK